MLIICVLLFFNQVLAVDPPFTPNDKDSIPFNRARHIVFFTGESRTGDLNFCENSDGFNLTEDVTNSCFYEPYVESLIIPSALMLIGFLIVLIISCSVGCSRCCCGGCCRSIKGICGGCYGTAKMSKSLIRSENTLFDTYVDINTTIFNLIDALDDIDLSPFESYMGNDTTLNDTKSLLNETESSLLSVDNYLTQIDKYTNAGNIVFEVFIYAFFSLPLLFIICYFIGAFTKIFWLVLPFMLFVTLFATCCIAIVVIEYPIVTVVADGCTYLIDELDPSANSSSSYEEFLMILRDCDNSILDTFLTTFDDVETQIIQQGLELFESVCSNELISSDDYITYDSEYICTNQSSLCLYNNQDYFESINPLYCPDASSVSNSSISEVIGLIDEIRFMDYKYYWVNSDEYTDPMECELLDWESTGSYEVSPVACKFYRNLTLDECRTECPSNITEYAIILYDLKQTAEQLATLIDTITNDIIPLISCDNINTLTTELKEAACYDFIQSETPLVVGLYGYAIVLLIFFAFSFLSIKRFRKTNYGVIEDAGYKYGEFELDDF
ncbi:Uncharacterized protein QTN25_004117 [Entamoeba marina]